MNDYYYNKNKSILNIYLIEGYGSHCAVYVENIRTLFILGCSVLIIPFPSNKFRIAKRKSSLRRDLNLNVNVEVFCTCHRQTSEKLVIN